MNVDDGVIDELLALSRTDLFAAIERIHAEPDPERAATLFAQVARRAYSNDKSVSRSVALARAGIQYCLCHPATPEQRPALRQRAKAMAYNMSADAWPGWGDEGIVSTASDLEAGLDAAGLNLKLARELQKGPLAESKAHWLLGAHRLATGDHAAARREFAHARERARDASNADDEQLNAGYAALVGALEGKREADAELGRIVKELGASDSENAKFYAEQLTTATAIFRARRASSTA